MISFEREAAAIKWLDEHPSLKADHHVGTWEYWPAYSTEISAAMQVIEKMRASGWMVQMTAEDESPTWNVSFDKYAPELTVTSADSDSLPGAISLAALEAIKER